MPSPGVDARATEVSRVSLASRILAAFALAASVAACAGQTIPPPAAATAAPDASESPAQRLAAGTYSTQAFRPTLTFTVPDGWELVADTPNWVQLRPQGAANLGLYLFRDARAASQDTGCPAAAADGVGTSSIDLVTWLRALKGVTASSPALVTVGGLRGSSLDLGIAPGWTTSCPFAAGVPTVPLIMNAGIDRWVLAGSERLRFYLLDLPAGGNVIVDVDDFEGSQIDTLLGQSTAVIRTFQFGTDAGASSAAPGSAPPASSGGASPSAATGSPSGSAAPASGTPVSSAAP